MDPVRKARRRRSVLYVPAVNEKALAKLATLDCDAAIIDLEDAIAPDDKDRAREAMRRFFSARPDTGPDLVIRINPLASEWGLADLDAARACRPRAILLPKVDTPRQLLDLDDALDEADAAGRLHVWAMIETPRAMLNIGAIAELGRDRAARLACLVAGTNDLVKETGIAATSDRRWLVPWLLQIVLAARAGGLDALDGVMNDFRDAEGFAAECAAARAMGFDGKTLIHPSQIEPANRIFSPSGDEIAEAEAIVTAFALPGNEGRGVISLDGRMVERLHLDMARRVLARAGREFSSGGR
ncbi:MAG: CoA ester lyase [Rhizobiaceae bacterium]|nr:CoA ester lyase [Rhizobiaceae bacterium]MCV0407549.1 CoA ester lyase [Rhizobiaceae bacterium]